MKRESYRRINLISDLCTKSIVGKGIEGYIEGVDFLNEKIKKIFYQGSEGSYSESVLEACFQETEYVACETFKETLGNVSSDDFALLPVENSLVGTVIEAYENLTESNLEVYLEIRKKINHALIGLQGAKIENITKVISHPQALQQCSNF